MSYNIKQPGKLDSQSKLYGQANNAEYPSDTLSSTAYSLGTNELSLPPEYERSFPKVRNQELEYSRLETPSKYGDGYDNTNRPVLTPGEILQTPNTWMNATIRKGEKSNDNENENEYTSSIDFTYEYSPYKTNRNDLERIIMSPSDKRESPVYSDFSNLVSQILSQSKPSENSSSRATSPPILNYRSDTDKSVLSSDWKTNQSVFASTDNFPSLHMSQYEPTVPLESPRTPDKRNDFLSRSAGHAIQPPSPTVKVPVGSQSIGDFRHSTYYGQNISRNIHLPDHESKRSFASDSVPKSVRSSSDQSNQMYFEGPGSPRQSYESIDAVPIQSNQFNRLDIDTPIISSNFSRNLTRSNSPTSSWNSSISSNLSQPWQIQSNEEYGSLSYYLNNEKRSQSSDIYHVSGDGSFGKDLSTQSFTQEFRHSYPKFEPDYTPGIHFLTNSLQSSVPNYNLANHRTTDSTFQRQSRPIDANASIHYGVSSQIKSQLPHRPQQLLYPPRGSFNDVDSNLGYQQYRSVPSSQIDDQQSLATNLASMQLSGSGFGFQNSIRNTSNSYPPPSSQKTTAANPNPQQYQLNEIRQPGVVYSNQNSSNQPHNLVRKPTPPTVNSKPQQVSQHTRSVESSTIQSNSLRIKIPGSVSSSQESIPNSTKTSPSSSVSFSKTQSQPELLESPRTKSIYKEFYRVFRMKERESLESAKAYVIETLTRVPEKSKWKIYLELAEIAKRNNEFDEARSLYEKVTKLQPFASQGWLEWSKMEEEYGLFEKSLEILNDGLKYCQFNEGLLTKAVKQHERKDHLYLARQMLSGLKKESLDKVWRSILEGALFEVRRGELEAARLLFKYLIQKVSWYGPIYFEAYRLDEREGEYKSALKIIKKGLAELPRYGPLWFGLLRIMERFDESSEYLMWLSGTVPKLTNMRYQLTKAVKSISPELIWKLYFEQAQAEERAADVAAFGYYMCIYDRLKNYSLPAVRNKRYTAARVNLVKSLLVCPSNLRWKVWLAGCRLELSAGHLVIARRLLCLAFANIPIKSKSYVYLEASRVEEFCGNIRAARRLLEIARGEASSEWKIHLESILLEARAGFPFQAVKLAEQSLKQHSGTGRLWAVLIQLCHRLETVSSKPLRDPGQSKEDEDIDDEVYNIFSSARGSSQLSFRVPNKFYVLHCAINHVPKSGEVWCEGARCVLNPMAVGTFDLGLAQKYLLFAIQFTPQYGDAFIEYLRLEMISQVLLPRVLAAVGLDLHSFIINFLNRDPDCDTSDLLDSNKTNEENSHAEKPSLARTEALNKQPLSSTLDISLIIASIEKLSLNADDSILPSYPELLDAFNTIKTKKLFRRCSNADPNYGTLWFHCRQRPFDSSSDVLQHAQNIISHELVGSCQIYVRAILYYIERNVRKYVLTLLQSPSHRSDVDAWLSEPATCKDRSSILDPASPAENFWSYVSFLNVYDAAGETLGKWRTNSLYKTLSLIDLNGVEYLSTDFICGVIDLNRFLYKKKISDEDRRKLLFGFDHIVS